MDLDDPLEGGPCYWLYCKDPETEHDKSSRVGECSGLLAAWSDEK